VVANNHLFLSHTFTLASYLPLVKNKIQSASYNAIVEDTVALLNADRTGKDLNFVMNDAVNDLLKNTVNTSISDGTEREEQSVLKAITEQLQYTHKISKDIHRLLTKNAIQLQ
jgi:gas vesicle protein